MKFDQILAIICFLVSNNFISVITIFIEEGQRHTLDKLFAKLFNENFC